MTTGRRGKLSERLAKLRELRAIDTHDCYGKLLDEAQNFRDNVGRVGPQHKKGIGLAEALSEGELAIIRHCVEVTGMTPAEIEAALAEQDDALFDFGEDYIIRRVGELGPVDGGEEEFDAQVPEVRRWLLTNFLYIEYVQFALENPAYQITWKTYSRWIAGKALVRLMTRKAGAYAMLNELLGGIDEYERPTFQDVHEFVAMGYNDERNPDKWLAYLVFEVYGANRAIDRILAEYEAKVRQVWRENYMIDLQESPLPSDDEFHYGQEARIAEKQAQLDAAVATFLETGKLKAAAQAHGTHYNTLKREIVKRGIVIPKHGGVRA